MLLIRILLKLTRPENAPSLREKQLPLGTAFHKWLLSILAHYYRCYASYDVIFIGKDFQLVRSNRDFEFETELKRMGFDVKPHLTSYKSKSLKKTRKNPYFKPFINCFSFSDTICIEAVDLNIVLERTNEINVTASQDVKIMISTPEDFIRRCTVHISNIVGLHHTGIHEKKNTELNKQSVELEEQAESSIRKNVREKKVGKEMRERIFRDELQEDKSVKADTLSTTIVRGIEIDDDF